MTVGRFNNVREVICAGLRLLEKEENQIIALKNAIHEGLNSEIVHNFNPEENLKELKSKKKLNG